MAVELRAQLPKGLQAVAFYDRGSVDGAGLSPHVTLAGAGVSLAWSGPAGLQLKATWARRAGANPQPTAAGTDQDGSLKRNRFWLNASLPF